MKNFKRILALVLVVFTLAMSMTIVNAADNKGTITVKNTTPGKSYSVYKIFDGSVNEETGSIVYTYDGTLPTNDYFTTNKAGNIVATEAATGTDGKLTAGAIAFLNTIKGTAVDTKVADGTSVVFDELEYGYYYVETNNGTAVMVDSTNPDATVVDKNSVPGPFYKKILENGEEVEVNTAGVGEKVEYIEKLTATNYAKGDFVTNYFIYDTMDDSLDFNDDIVVTVAGETLTLGDDYSVTYDKSFEEGGQVYDFIVNIFWTDDDGNFIYDDGDQIVVTYSATVNENVEWADAMVNEATYKYIAKPTKTVTEKNPKDETLKPDPEFPTYETFTYATKLKIAKVDEDGKALTGAKFALDGHSTSVMIVNEEIFTPDVNGEYWMRKDGTYTKTAPTPNDYFRPATPEDGRTGGYVLVEGVYTPATPEQLEDETIPLFILVYNNSDEYDDINKKYSKVTTVTKDTDGTVPCNFTGWVDEDGYITFTGLGEGEYTVTELVAPNGFNLLPNPIKVTVTFDEDTCTFSATYIEVGSDEEPADLDLVDGVIEMTVINESGTILPTTGGMGTTLIIVCGAVLFLAAGVVLVTKKRMYNEG